MSVCPYWYNNADLRDKVAVALLILSQIIITFELGLLAPSFSNGATDDEVSVAMLGAFLASIPFFKLFNTLIYDFLTVKWSKKWSITGAVSYSLLHCILCSFSFIFACSGVSVWGARGIIPFLYCLFIAFGSALYTVASKRAVDKSHGKTKWLKISSKVGYFLGIILIAALSLVEGNFCRCIYIGIGVALVLLAAVTPFFYRADEDQLQAKYSLPLLKNPRVFARFLYTILADMTARFLDPVICLQASRMAYYYTPILLGTFVSGLLHLFICPSPLLSFIFQDRIQSKEAFIALSILMGIFRPLVSTSQMRHEEGLVYGEANRTLYVRLMKLGELVGQILGLILSGTLTEIYSFPLATTVMALLLLAGERIHFLR